MLALDGAQKLVELGGLAQIEPGRRLVEAEQHRLGAHGACDFEPPLAAIRQLAGGIVGAVGEPGPLEPIAGLLDRSAFGVGVGADAEHAGERESGRTHERIVLRDHQVLQHRHAGKQADVLERARHPRLLSHQVVGHAFEQEQRSAGAFEAAPAAISQAVEFVPYGGITELQRDASLGRLVKAGDAIEHGGLAGAVRPDQRRDVRALGGKREVVDGKQAAEAHGEMVDAQDRGAHP